MKKLLFLLTVLVTSLPAMAYVDEIMEFDGITYKIYYDYDEDDTSYHEDKRWCEIISSSSDLHGDIIIPTFVTHNGKNYFVGGIFNEAFNNRDKITSVSIPEGVELIGKSAFCRCTALTDIFIPSSLIAIWESAFMECSKLTKIKLPEGIKEIRSSAFAGCTNLDTINIPSTVTSIDKEVFSYCDSLTSVNLSGQITHIGNDAFRGCYNLVSLNLPESVTYIGSYAFSGCVKWRLSLPSSLTEIGDYVFSDCLSQSSIIIPQSVTSIGKDPFRMCSGLQKINVDSENPNYASVDGVLFDKKIIQIISYPHDATRGEYTLPTTVTDIPSGTFWGQQNLTSVTIPGNVTTLNGSTFPECPNLNSVTLPETLTTIGNSDFYRCTSLTHIEIPNLVTKIDQDAFRYCYALESVDLPESLQNIGFSAFSECRALTSIEIPDSTRYLDEGVFCACDNLKSVILPASLIRRTSSVITYYGWAFSGCYDIEDVYYKAENPIELTATMFSQATYDKATLHVPAAALEKAAVTLPWSQFKNIKAHDFSSAITDVTVDAENDAPIEVYHLNGIKIADSTDSLPAGLYIVRQGNTVKKIAVK